MDFLQNFTHWTFKDTPHTLTALLCGSQPDGPLTAIGLITHIWAVGSVVTQVFHEDTRPVTTPVLILHAVSDDAGDDWKGRRGTVGEDEQRARRRVKRVTTGSQRQIKNAGQTRNYNVTLDKRRALVSHRV